VKKSAIIVAGGAGTRMNAGIPKQFLVLGGRPVLMHCISAFLSYDASINLVVTLPKDHINSWEKLCRQYQFQLPHTVAVGGEFRFHSVKNALALIPDDHLVAIHDGVRPLVSVALIRLVFEAAQAEGNCVPVVPLRESLREIYGNENKPADRRLFRVVQTPQVFLASTIKQAYDQPFKESFTDDATALENLGEKIHLIEGDPFNIKITLSADLIIANALMSALSSGMEGFVQKPL